MCIITSANAETTDTSSVRNLFWGKGIIAIINFVQTPTNLGVCVVKKKTNKADWGEFLKVASVAK